MGAGQIGALQQFIVITAIPVSLLLPSLWTGPRAAIAMAQEQGILDGGKGSREAALSRGRPSLDGG